MLFLDTGTLRISYQSGLQALASCSRNVGNTVFTGLGKQHSYIPCTATLVVVTQHKQFLTIHPPAQVLMERLLLFTKKGSSWMEGKYFKLKCAWPIVLLRIYFRNLVGIWCTEANKDGIIYV